MRILSISNHKTIKLSRELLLKSVGYEVISATSDSALSGKMPDDVRLVLIGQTVPDRVAARVISAVRKSSSHMRIMHMRKQPEGPPENCDGSCFLEDGPATFLRCVSDMLTKGHTRDCRD